MPTAEAKPHFANPGLGEAARREVAELQKQGLFKLHAFAVQPERLMLLLAPAPERTLRDVLYELRLRIGRASRASGLTTPLWAPRSEIEKYFEAESAGARALEISSQPGGVLNTPADASSGVASNVSLEQHGAVAMA